MSKIKILSILLFLMSCNYADAKNFYVYKVDRVVDGDTIKLDTSSDGSLLKELGLSVRIYGVDTPEKKGKCQKEKNLANLATEFTRKLVGNKQIMIEVKQWDKYGGRIVGIVKVGDKIIADELIKEGLAIPYFGEKKIFDWCL